MSGLPRARASLAAALLVVAALGRAPAARADDAADEAADLRADTWRAAGTTAGALVLEGVVAATWKNDHCRICGAGTIDQKVRDALLWSDPNAAARTSDVLATFAIPLLAAGDALRATKGWGDAARDVLVVAEAASLAGLATTVAKAGFARLRPGLPDQPGQDPAAYHSFWSGHTSLAFSVATAQAMQDTIRGDPAAPWVWGVGLTLASAVGYLRIAGDAHWLTDVVAGAAVGTAFGVGVPLLEQRLVRGVTLAPAPGGVAVRF